jgi:hypothetical protein
MSPRYFIFILAFAFAGLATASTADTSLAGRILCVFDSGGHAVGTAAKIGDAVVTAKHVVIGCKGKIEPAWSSSKPTNDISIITYGDPGVCKDAQVGDRLVYLGFPGRGENGSVRHGPVQLIQEKDFGKVVELDVSIIAASHSKPYIRTLEGMTRAVHTRVRPGYSGGPVFSAKDGRIVGIVNAIANGDGEHSAYFTPISKVCAMIRKEAPYE